MSDFQLGIIADVPSAARYLTFSLKPNTNPGPTLQALSKQADGEKLVVGLGQTLLQQLGATIPQLHEFPASQDHGVEIPSTPIDLWCWLRGEDRGDLVLQSNQYSNGLYSISV